MSSTPQRAPANRGPVPREIVLEHLEKVLSSDVFTRSDRMKRFLRFVVEQVLEGKAEELKEYSVAVHVFDKPASFDPHLDPIVRVEAGRLRSKLREYYEAEGAQEPVRITIRKRCYVPEFESREAPGAEPPVPVPLPGDSPKAQLTSVAVLPFVDLSPRSNQGHLCDGMTEEVLNALSRVEGLHVASRTSVMKYKGSDLDVHQIGACLTVGSVLEGSVRRIRKRLRLTAQLVSVADGYQIWSELYDRDIADIFAVQSEIAESIVRALRVRLIDGPRPAASHPQGTADTTAYEWYLQGRYRWNRRRKEDLVKAVRFFDRAVGKDPSYALAYAGLADSQALLAWHGSQPSEEHWDKAAKAAGQAIALDAALGAGWASLALVRAAHEWLWEESEQGFQRAIELDAGYATAHHWYAVYCLAPQQRLHEALLHIRRAEELDPLSAVIAAHMGWILYFRREYDQAIEQLQKALRLDPAFHLTHVYLGTVLDQCGRFDEALAAYEAAAALAGREGPVAALTALSLAHMGRQRDAADLCSVLKTQAKRKHVSPLDLSIGSLAGGDPDRALEHLTLACDSRCARLIHVRVDPLFDPLKTDPRLLAILRSLALDR